MARASALPPKRLSAQTQCVHGVTPEAAGNGFVACVSWRRLGSGTLLVEHLGIQPKRWFAGVAHDVALAALAFHSGDRCLQRVESVSGGGTYERLNFPLDAYLDNELFWQAMELSFGELLKRLRAPSNTLVKVRE